MLRDLAGDERSAYLRGIHPIWGGLLEERRFLDFQRRLADAPESAGRYRLVGWFERERLVSAMKLYTLHGACEGARLSVLGIGAVYTPPALRRKGRAREMIAAALAEAKAGGLGMALLFSDIGTDYYERLGFRVVESREASVDAGDLPRGAGSFRPAMAGDEPLLARLFLHARAKLERLHLARDEWTVRFQLRRLRELARARSLGEPEWGVVAKARGGEAGAMVRFGRDTVDVLEAAWESESSRDALLAGLRDCVHRTGRARLRFWPAGQLRGLYPAVERRNSIAMIAPLGAASLPGRGGQTELALLDHN